MYTLHGNRSVFFVWLVRVFVRWGGRLREQRTNKQHHQQVGRQQDVLCVRAYSVIPVDFTCSLGARYQFDVRLSDAAG